MNVPCGLRWQGLAPGRSMHAFSRLYTTALYVRRWIESLWDGWRLVSFLQSGLDRNRCSPNSILACSRSWPASSLNAPQIIAASSQWQICLHFDRNAVFCTVQLKYVGSCTRGNVLKVPARLVSTQKGCYSWEHPLFSNITLLVFL